MSKANEQENTQKEEETILSEDVQKTLDEMKQTNENLVAELKDLRTKKQEAEQAALALLETPPDEKKEGEFDADKAVEEALAKRERQSLESYLKDAEAKLRSSKSDISTDNDPGDIKFNAYKRVLSKFNIQGVKTKDEIDELLLDAYDFYKRKESKQDESKLNDFGGTKNNSFVKPDDTSLFGLSKSEQEIISEKGWSKEKYLKLKEKQPQFIEQLLRISSR
jgi:hypothetical protein